MLTSGAADEHSSAAFYLRDTPLSPRQLQCLGGAAHGFTEREIAVQLGIACGTVHNYLRNARERIGARNTTEAVARALVAGWLCLKEPEE